MSSPINLPEPIPGIEFERLDHEKLCSGCGKLMLSNQLVIRRNARGRNFKEILPIKNGICLNCGSEKISDLSVSVYEKLLEQNNQYENLNEKSKITESEEKSITILEFYIEKMQDFSEKLSTFVEFAEQEQTKYYDDELEKENE